VAAPPTYDQIGVKGNKKEQMSLTRIMDKDGSRNEFEKKVCQWMCTWCEWKPKERLTISGGVQGGRDGKEINSNG